MVAVGAIAAGRADLRGVLVPLSFVSAMVAGAMLGMAGIGLPYLETGIALSLVVFGAALSQIAAAARRGHGAGGPVRAFPRQRPRLEIPENSGGHAYAAGFVLGTSALHAVGALSALKLCRWAPILRAAGIATSLVGIFLGGSGRLKRAWGSAGGETAMFQKTTSLLRRLRKVIYYVLKVRAERLYPGSSAERQPKPSRKAR